MAASNVHALRVGPFEIADMGGVSLSNLSVDVGAADSTCSIERVTIGRLSARAGSASLTLSDASLSKVTARLNHSGEGDVRLLSLHATQVEVKRVDAVVRHVPRVRHRQVPAGLLQLDALRGMQGMLHVSAKDALWNIDVEAIVPLVGGTLNLNAIDVNHIGPDSRVALGPTGIVLYPPGRPPIEVLRFDSAELKTRDGVLDLESFVRHLVAAPSDQPTVTVEPRMRALAPRVRMDGEIQLGAGILGTQANHVELNARDVDANRVKVLSPGFANGVVLAMSNLILSSAQLALSGISIALGAVSAKVEGRVIPKSAQGDTPGELILELTVTGATCANVRLASRAPQDGGAEQTRGS